MTGQNNTKNKPSLLYIGIWILILFSTVFTFWDQFANQDPKPEIPALLYGEFIDDYGNNYSISNEFWVMEPDHRYKILEWNIEDKYLIARNDVNNPYDPGKYSRFDWINLNDSTSYHWGYCHSIFNAGKLEDVMVQTDIDPENPKVGCNGFPFTRMKTE